MVFDEQDITLPALRPDIEIFSGPLEKDGSPTYVIHDPVAGSYSKIGWGEAAVLQQLKNSQPLSSVVHKLGEETTLNATPKEVLELCEDVDKHGLTLDSLVKPAKQLYGMAQSKKTGPLKWLARHYLYFRVPLFRPDQLLAKTLPWARLLAARHVKWITVVAACFGLYFLSQRFESYVATFPHFVSVRGFLAYFLVIAFLKTAHELGHAFVAKHYGVRIPTMGIAFMIFAPVAYSDVTDAWRLRNRKKRLAIALAGVKVELVIGAFALAFWGLTPPGLLNSTCFLLSSTTLLSTLLVNLNPCMRYDGYYILSDLWGIDNLSSQSGQFTKWFLRKKLLGLETPCPITMPQPRQQFQMICYSLCAWIYRLFLYLGIATIVYYKFTKSLGVTLFVFVIISFIVLPILKEIKVMIMMIGQMKLNWKICVTLTAVLLVVAWAVLPFPRSKKAPAALLPVHIQTIYAPDGGQVKDILVKQGDKINSGDVVIRLESEALNNQIEYQSVSAELIRNNIETVTVDNDDMANLPQLQKQLAAVEEELAGLIAQRNQLATRAKISGTIVELDPSIDHGVYVKKHQALGCIVSTDKIRIDAFVSEKEVNQLKVGQNVTFWPVDGHNRLACMVERIDPLREVSVDLLDIGAVAAKELPLVHEPSSDKLTFVESSYRVTLGVTGNHPENARLGKSGHIRYRTSGRSLAWEVLLYCYSVLVRESSF